VAKGFNLPSAHNQEQNDTMNIDLNAGRFRSIFDIAPLGIAVADRLGGLLEANPAFLAMFGFSLQEAQGHNFIDLVHPEDRDTIADLVQGVRDGKADSYQAEKRCICKDGREFRAVVRCTVLRDGQGDITHWLGIMEDISARRSAEKTLAESERRYRMLFEEASEGILAVEAESRKIRYANPAAGRMLGYPLEELTRLGIEDIHPTDSLKEVMNRFGAQMRQEQRSASQVPFLRKDRSVIHCNVNSCVMEIDGRKCVVGFIQDVSDRVLAEKERRRLAAQVQQAQKMEAIGTLAGGIAHDFNNLLMGIQGNISLLLLDKAADHRDVTYLKNIEKSVMRASELTRQILGFARGGKYEVKVTDINTLLEKTAEMFGRTRKEITIRQNLQKAPWKIEADQSQLQQVLLNLLVNAWQAMPGGGELVLQTANVVIEAGDPDKPPDALPGSYVRIDVTDTGVGMDTHTQARIFEPFFTTREKGQGTGLGLSSAFGIVKNHNGFITVTSETGRGSTFSVFFPATSGAVTEKPKPAGASRSGGNTILLVEDEEMVATIGRQMLERLGYRVVVAQTGDEALALYEKRRAEIDLVILDMIMPGMGGGAVFDRIRSIDPQAAVLLSSGYSLNGQALEIMKRGCRGFIQKPFSIEQLKEKISEILFAG
jgi:PAS domain S-box-containing protein